MALKMRTAWANFATTGNPSSRSVSWPAIGHGERVLSPVEPRPVLQEDFASSHHCSFWRPGETPSVTSTWLVLLPGFILAGIGLGVTSTGLASAALAAVEPARAGMAAGLINTLRQVGTATGVAVFGALYASKVATATLHELAGRPVPSGTAHQLAAAVASGAGTRVAALAPPAARAAVSHAAHAGTASGLNDVLLAAAVFAAFGAIVAFASGGPDRTVVQRTSVRSSVDPGCDVRADASA